MIVLDNSVLSALVRLDLLKLLHGLHKKIIVSPLVVEEYSIKWNKDLPEWIVVEKIEYSSPENLPFGLS